MHADANADVRVWNMSIGPSSAPYPGSRGGDIFFKIIFWLVLWYYIVLGLKKNKSQYGLALVNCNNIRTKNEMLCLLQHTILI